jgi:hypothetical protein
MPPALDFFFCRLVSILHVRTSIMPQRYFCLCVSIVGFVAMGQNYTEFSGNVLSTLHILHPQYDPTGGRYCYTHFTGEETQMQEVRFPSPRSQSKSWQSWDLILGHLAQCQCSYLQHNYGWTSDLFVMINVCPPSDATPTCHPCLSNDRIEIRLIRIGNLSIFDRMNR